MKEGNGMSAYSELIKNFEKIRAYMREFYVYGFKSREEYHLKSARSYDDERRRMESWLGEHMRFFRTPEGKRVFISIDSRTSSHNPFYKAWKTKSFTDGDITLHFVLFDILYAPEIVLSLSEIMEKMDCDYFSYFEAPTVFDESTVRKKLKEYTSLGLIAADKKGKGLYYHRTADTIALEEFRNALDFYSEAAPCGVIGSFLLDKLPRKESVFSFKHHYMTGALDSGVLASLFTAMQEKRIVTALVYRRRGFGEERIRLIPLRIFVSAQSGRQHLLAYEAESDSIRSFRVDYLSDVKHEQITPRFDELRERLTEMQKNMWGVGAASHWNKRLEKVSFTVRFGKGEEYIARRLEREKRCGTVEHLDENTCRFSAEIYDATEIIPWIRTFICRITEIHFSNPVLEKRFLKDLEEMYRLYGIEDKEERL